MPSPLELQPSPTAPPRPSPLQVAVPTSTRNDAFRDLLPPPEPRTPRQSTERPERVERPEPASRETTTTSTDSEPRTADRSDNTTATDTERDPQRNDEPNADRETNTSEQSDPSRDDASTPEESSEPVAKDTNTTEPDAEATDESGTPSADQLALDALAGTADALATQAAVTANATGSTSAASATDAAKTPVAAANAAAAAQSAKPQSEAKAQARVAASSSVDPAVTNTTTSAQSAQAAANAASTDADADADPQPGRNSSNIQLQPGDRVTNANPNTAAGQSAANTAASSTAASAPTAPLTNPLANASTQAAPTPAGAQATTDADAPDPLNAARLNRGLTAALNQKNGAVTLRLTPAELGTVRIHLQITGTNVSARFHAETPGAQNILASQLGQLRTSLEASGLSVDRISVQSLQTNTNNQASANGDGAPGQSRQDASTPDGQARNPYRQDASNRNPNNASAQPESFDDLIQPAAA
ncbi:MAG: flagellar hook-length control protein FliK [Planctomycetota bacterium]